MSKKQSIGFIGIGIGVTILALMIIGVSIVMNDINNPYMTLENNGMSPAIIKGEIVKYDRQIHFDSIDQGDIIAIYSEKKSIITVHRVLEIVQEEPRQVKTRADNLEDSIFRDLIINEEEYAGKVIRVYPDLESARNDAGGRIPQ